MNGEICLARVAPIPQCLCGRAKGLAARTFGYTATRSLTVGWQQPSGKSQQRGGMRGFLSERTRFCECAGALPTAEALMPSFVSAESLAFGLAIVACHFGLAFFRKAAQNGSGCKPCLWLQSRGKPRSQLPATGWAISVEWSQRRLNPPPVAPRMRPRG
jgi:hypothetical protein